MASEPVTDQNVEAPASAAPEPSPAPAPGVASDFPDYDLGDVSNTPEFDQPAVPGAAPPADPSNQPEAPSPKPRTPDGRFAPQPEGQHSRQTLRLAQELGFSANEIAQTAPAVLDDLVYHMARRDLSRASEHNRQASLQSGSERRPESSPPEAEPAPESDVLPGDDWHPQLKPVLERIQRELRETREKLARFEQHQQAQATEQAVTRADRAFSKYESILGKGSGHSLDQQGAEYQRRIAVLSLVRTNKSQDSLETKIDQAVSTLFGAQASAPATAPAGGAAPTADEWRTAGLARPTHRANSNDPPGEKKALKTAARILHDQGHMDEADFPNGAFPE